MERLHNQYDKEYMKLAMLKHEETFREQVYELHRLYRIQKRLMKDIAENQPHYRISCYNNNSNEVALGKCRVNSEIEYDHGDLELTLGPRSYYQKKIKASEPGIQSDNSGPGFSWSRQQKWGPEKPVSGQDRLNTPPWLLQALSFNMT